MLNNSNGFTFCFPKLSVTRICAIFRQSGFLPDQTLCIGYEKQVPSIALEDVYHDPYSGYLFRPEQQVEETLKESAISTETYLALTSTQKCSQKRCKNLT